MQWPSVVFARRAGCDVAVLVPPYKTVSVRDYAHELVGPPVGTVYSAQASHTLTALAQVTAAVHRWPWIIPCIILREEGPVEPILMLVSELRGRIAIVKRGGAGIRDAASILAGVRNRKTPDAEMLAEYLETRVDDARLRDAVGEQFRCAFEPSRCPRASISTYSRLFARFGPFTSRDWRNVARMCIHCCNRTSWDSDQVLTVRTAHRYCRRYLNVPYHSVTDYVGWEWVLETALRNGAYARVK